MPFAELLPVKGLAFAVVGSELSFVATVAAFGSWSPSFFWPEGSEFLLLRFSIICSVRMRIRSSLRRTPLRQPTGLRRNQTERNHLVLLSKAAPRSPNSSSPSPLPKCSANRCRATKCPPTNRPDMTRIKLTSFQVTNAKPVLNQITNKTRAIRPSSKRSVMRHSAAPSAKGHIQPGYGFMFNIIGQQFEIANNAISAHRIQSLQMLHDLLVIGVTLLLVAAPDAGIFYRYGNLFIIVDIKFTSRKPALGQMKSATMRQCLPDYCQPPRCRSD